MNHSWPLAGCLWVVAVWTVVAARYPDAQWERLTLNWPVPWSRLASTTRGRLRAALWLLAAVAAVVGVAAVPR